jgi:hypothetical protein
MAHAVKTPFIFDEQAAAYVEDPLWRWRGLIRLGRDLLRDKVALGGAIIAPFMVPGYPWWWQSV